MKRAVASLLLLVLSGCGTAAIPATIGQRVDGQSLERMSLQGDLAKKLSPIAARKAVQTAMKLALKKDAKTVDEWEQSVSQKNDADQVAFLQKRLKTLQRAVTAADVVVAALEDVTAVKEALSTTKADDKEQAKAWEKQKAHPASEQVEFLFGWADLIAKGLTSAAASF